MMPNAKAPQVEEGYTRIANELLEAIVGFGFTAHQLVVMLTLIRKTYGYQKKEDDISQSQLADLCNIPRNHISVALKKLEAMNVISKKAGKFGTVLSINKDYSIWNKGGSANQPIFCAVSPSTDSVLPPSKPVLALVSAKVVPISTEIVPPSLVQILDSASTDSVRVGVTESVHTKENLPKENQQKKADAAAPRVSRKKAEATFADWMVLVAEEGRDAIPEDHAVFRYAAEIKLPVEFVDLCWFEFRNEHITRADKKQKDWPAAFHVYVRKNYYRLWFKKGDQYQLTTTGIQLQDEMRRK